MSMLYKSLQKLRRQDNQAVPVPSFISQYGAASSRKRYLRTAVISLSLLFLMTLPVLVVQSRLDTYQEDPGMMESRDFAVNGSQDSETVKHNETRDDLSRSQPDDFQADSHEPEVFLEPDGDISGLKEKSKPAGQDAADERMVQDHLPEPAKNHQNTLPVEHDVEVGRPATEEYPQGYSQVRLDRDLQEHFTRQAQRNRTAMSLNRDMEAAFAAGDYEHVKEYMVRLKDILPGASPLVLKWEGILAMQDNDYEKARRKFQAVLSQNPEDSSARANLALAMLKLDRTDQARKILAELRAKSPDNPMIETLTRLLR